MKATVKNELLKEQHWTCCYCGIGIESDTSHIEHLNPRDRCPITQQLAYDNLVASCNGGIDKSHCGHKKKEWYSRTLFVSPLKRDCETYFCYSSDGRITPTADIYKSLAAKTTIDNLGLNDYDLVEGRKAALEALGYYSGTLTRQDAEQIINIFSCPDANGHLSSYCVAIVYLMSEEINYLV